MVEIRKGACLPEQYQRQQVNLQQHVHVQEQLDSVQQICHSGLGNENQFVAISSLSGCRFLPSFPFGSAYPTCLFNTLTGFAPVS